MLYAIAFIMFSGDLNEDLNYFQCNLQASMIQVQYSSVQCV